MSTIGVRPQSTDSSDEAEDGAERQTGRTVRRFVRRFVVLLLILGAARIALPHALAAYVARTLRGVEGYSVEIGGIDAALWRGAYEIEALVVRDDTSTSPLLDVRRADLSVEWGALLRGRVLGEIVLHGPVVTVEAGPQDRSSDANGTGGAGEEQTSWTNSVASLLPIRIDRFAVRDAELRWIDEGVSPPVDLYMTDFYLEALNLSNARGAQADLVAEIEAAGRPLGTGEFELVVALNPIGPDLAFELAAELRELELTDWNDFVLAYANVDAEAGRVGLYTELAVADGRAVGYVKTILEDVEILRWGEIDGPEDALEALWEGFVGLAAELLENQPRDRLATRIPFEGEVGGTSVDLGVAIAELLRNAFVEALRPALDDTIELEDLEESDSERRSR